MDTFDALADWDDLTVPSPDNDEPNPTLLDPRPTPSEIIDLDAEVASLTAKLSHLTMRRSQLLASRALINNIPLELLSRVFELAVHVTPSLVQTLSLVSRSWRNIILTTPSLHTYIKLDESCGFHANSDDSRSTSEVFLGQIKRQLARAHDAKLHIDIDFRYVSDISDVHLIMKELEPRIHRCFYVKFSFPDRDWLSAARDHVSLLGPALEQLHLHIDSSDPDDQPPPPFLLAPCPRLYRVTLEHTPLVCIRGPPVPPSYPNTDTPSVDELSQGAILHPSLRHLHVIRDQSQSSSPSTSRNLIPLASLITTLSATPSLVTLHIQSAVFMLLGTEQIFLPEPQKIKMPNLKSLVFNLVDSANMGIFLDNIHCERLKTLRIQMDGVPGAEDCLSFLMRACEARPGRYTALYPVVTIPHQPLRAQTPFPALRHLDLRAVSTTGPALYPFIRVLHNLPYLTALAISSPPNGCFGSRLWELMSAPSRSHDQSSLQSPSALLNTSQGIKQEWIVPALKALIVQYARDVSGHELLKVVRERRGASYASRLHGAHARAVAGRSVSNMGSDLIPTGVPLMLPEEEADVAAISYLKITGCYGLEREGDIVDELKRLVKTVIL